MERIRMGDRARDIVTGYAGTVVGTTRWLTGCNSYGLQTMKADSTETITLWFDESRVEVVERGVVKLITEANAVEPGTFSVLPPSPAPADVNGGPQPTPRPGNSH